MFQPEFSLPVALPLRFFRTAPLWLALAALAAFGLEAGEWPQRYSPALLAITHLLMLGFIGNIMVGALLQVCAVLTGIRAQHPERWGWMLWLGLQTGTALLALGLWQMQTHYLQTAAVLLLLSLGALAVWLLTMLWRSRQASALVYPIAGLALTVLSGALLVGVLSVAWPALPLADLLRAHITLGSMAWIFALIIVVGLTVIPMFLVAPSWPARISRYLPAGLAIAVLGAVINAQLLVLLLMPALIWLIALYRLLHQSQRRADPARYLWAWGGFNLIVCTALVPWLDGLSTSWPAQEGIPVLLALHFIVAGLLPIFTAMQAKIIPFLLWMDYRLQVLSGGQLRHMGQLWPEKHLKRLSYLVYLLGISLLPLYLFAFKAIPALIMIFAAALSYCLERAIVHKKRACVS
ncbi:hypothetical protein HZU75_11685 [Chitinibacter fontanus]|uniref:Uncharacterized protein n=1 Tax=Chitinibacter fontanus TaxID=1737446 RepID=A0A7D5VB16_9NEIS|nr:hypothetical protein [Chitinibacter fontanus]QLI82132.1 hypothetical protein HZU75_11685 [Chitinibacter fontanus]